MGLCAWLDSGLLIPVLEKVESVPTSPVCCLWSRGSLHGPVLAFSWGWLVSGICLLWSLWFGEDILLQSLLPLEAVSLQLPGPFALSWGGISLVWVPSGKVLWFTPPRLSSCVLFWCCGELFLWENEVGECDEQRESCC